MPETKYANFVALYPFFEIIQKGLTGLVDGEHYFDTIADDAFFDFRYRGFEGVRDATGRLAGA
jgi:hypothetical protein